MWSRPRPRPRPVTGGPEVIIIDEHLADSDAMAYEIDRTDDMWALADYVEKGIEVPQDNGTASL